MTNRDKFNKEIITKSNDELAFILSNSPCRYCYYEGECAGVTCDIGVKKWLETPCRENPPAENVAEPQQEAPAERNPDKTMMNDVTTDNVNHPAHYNREGAMECIREMVVVFGYEATINFCKLNAWKYRYRASEKNGSEDMAKSDWYVKKAEELKSEAGYF